MDIGLSGDLAWNVGIDSSKLAQLLPSIPDNIKASVSTKDNFKAFLAVPDYGYQLGYAEIITNGEGSSLCYWRINDDNLCRIGTEKFAIVFKVPKKTDAITVRGTVWAEPKMKWLTSNLEDVAIALSERFQKLLGQGDDVASQFARGDAEFWNLRLPK